MVSCNIVDGLSFIVEGGGDVSTATQLSQAPDFRLGGTG